MNQKNSAHDGCGHATDVAPVTTEITVVKHSGPWLVRCVGPDGPEQSIQLCHGQRIVIGTARHVDLRLRDACVSGRHCVLDANGAELLLVDLGSKNGVYVGNLRVQSAQLVAAPTAFTIGRTRISVHQCITIAESTAAEPDDGILGHSEPIARLKRDVRRVAKLRAPVLIIGETGVGKDVVARALHRLSGRTGHYVPINVATIPDTLADSELFGHRKGAFTGALQARVGAFEQAHAGTLFLDEVGELSTGVQAKMLRILEDGVVRPVGVTVGRAVDVRIVSATWASLGERSAAGAFRFDLLQRLSVITIDVPPLRSRRSDIAVLAEHWLQRHGPEVGYKQLTSCAIERLCAHDWPGNVRELGGTIYRACINTEGDVIDVDDVVRALSIQNKRKQFERNPVEILALAGGNVSEAARRAGLPRTSFRTWLRRAGNVTSDPHDEQRSAPRLCNGHDNE
jgi:DNA-binding NtrC family response regulator